MNLTNGKLQSVFLIKFLFWWRSPEAKELWNIVQQLGIIPDLCVEEYILNFFKDLNLQSMNISNLCPTTARFTSMKILNLSFNNISRIENLPSTLEELYLNGNSIDHLALKEPISTLYHLGINRNKIRQPALT